MLRIGRGGALADACSGLAAVELMCVAVRENGRVEPILMIERRDGLKVKEGAPPVVRRGRARTPNGEPKGAGSKQAV